MIKHVSRDFHLRGSAQFPVLEPGFRRCSCQAAVAADKWKDHIKGCTVRAKKQAAAKAS